MEVAIGKKIAGKGRQSDKHMEGNNNFCLCVHCLLFFLCSWIPFRPDLQITELEEEQKWGNTASIYDQKYFSLPYQPWAHSCCRKRRHQGDQYRTMHCTCFLSIKHFRKSSEKAASNGWQEQRNWRFYLPTLFRIKLDNLLAISIKRLNSLHSLSSVIFFSSFLSFFSLFFPLFIFFSIYGKLTR